MEAQTDVTTYPDISAVFDMSAVLKVVDQKRFELVLTSSERTRLNIRPMQSETKAQTRSLPGQHEGDISAPASSVNLPLRNESQDQSNTTLLLSSGSIQGCKSESAELKPRHR